MDGSQQQQLTFGSDYDAEPIFTPDGNHIWFRRTPQGKIPSVYTMYTMLSSGHEVKSLDSKDEQAGREAAFSPKDNGVFYLGAKPYSEKGAEIWWMHQDTTGKHFVGKGDMPNVSADGSQIVFLLGQISNEIWIMASDGNQRKQIYASPTGKRYVALSPDGLYIYMLEESNNNGDTYLSRVKRDGSAYQRLVKTSSL